MKTNEKIQIRPESMKKVKGVLGREYRRNFNVALEFEENGVRLFVNPQISGCEEVLQKEARIIKGILETTFKNF